MHRSDNPAYETLGPYRQQRVDYRVAAIRGVGALWRRLRGGR